MREALRAGRSLDRILISQSSSGPRIQEIIDLARQNHTLLRFEAREILDRASNSANHQGVIAFGAPHRYAELDTISPASKLLVVLDGVEDPHNLGAIVRTAHAAGAAAVIIPERRAAGLTDTVAKASAGALEHLPIVRVVNITKTLDKLKKEGWWIYGLDERGETPYSNVEYVQPSVFVLGGEGYGIHQNTRKHCDVLIRIPMAGAVSSLNVSVAAGIVLFECLRRAGN